MKNRPGEKIKLASLDELLGVVNEESAMEIEINKIHAFKNHPFKVLDDEKMQDLIESVKLSGVLTPVLLRVDSNDEYEMISGHRRLHAAKMAGLNTIPAIVRELSDDDAVIAMVDANIQREELLPSEKAFAYLPYQEARQQNVSITVENYRVISIHEMQEEEKVADIWKRMKKQCEVSDVLVLNRDGEINCYYVDENYPQYLAGFIRINTSGALITMETENYQIDGKKGNWIATDTIIIDGKQFYLMEHQVYRDQAQGVILDAYGKMVVEECKKFDEKTKQKIHNYIQQQAPLNSVEQLKQDGQIRLEHYQKFYQNGTYERSRESGTEANYNMVDGLVNNQKRNQEKTFDARSNKQTSRNEQDNKPKKRRSVIKRLHQKQIAIARRSGKPIPKYLDQEIERKRG